MRLTAIPLALVLLWSCAPEEKMGTTPPPAVEAEALAQSLELPAEVPPSPAPPSPEVPVDKTDPVRTEKPASTANSSIAAAPRTPQPEILPEPVVVPPPVEVPPPPAAPPVPAADEVKIPENPVFLQFSLKEVQAKAVLDRNGRRIVLTVPYGTSPGALTPVFSTNDSLVRLDGADFESDSQALNWAKPRKFLLTSQDGVEAEWTVEVAVTPASKDSKLGNLQVGEYQLMPPFDPAVFSYSLFVPQDLKALSLTAQTSFPKARMTIQVNDGVSAAGLEPGRPKVLALVPGENNLFLKVTAEDGKSNTYYVFVVKRR